MCKIADTAVYTGEAAAVTDATILEKLAKERPSDAVQGLRQTTPFRFIDEVLEVQIGSASIVGRVEMGATEDRLYDPELFSSLLVEALAQLSGILLRELTGSTAGGVLAGIEKARFAPYPPAPSSILLHAQVVQSAHPHFVLDCTARQAGRSLCDCTLHTRTNTGADR